MTCSKFSFEQRKRKDKVEIKIAFDKKLILEECIEGLGISLGTSKSSKKKSSLSLPSLNFGFLLPYTIDFASFFLLFFSLSFYF